MGLPRFLRNGLSEAGDVEMVPRACGGVGRKGFSERGDVERVPRG